MIYLFGDVHGNFDHVAPIVEKDRPDAIIFLGDIWPQRSLEEELAGVLDKTEVWFIPGNHDAKSREVHDNVFNSKLADRNLHGRIVEVAGLRVAGLGGIFRQEIWYPKPQDALPSYDSYADYQRQMEARAVSDTAGRHIDISASLRKHRTSIFYRDWFNLYGQQADILVTHEAPSCHPHGFRVIDELARSMKVKFAFHGHHHDRQNYQPYFKELGFHAHGVGFCGVSDQYGGMILPGDFDKR